MTNQLNQLALALASAALLTVAGCGGGGGGSSNGGGDSTPKVDVPVTVIDGAIENATVCLDINLNGSCDANEPSGKTDAAGKATLQVTETDRGKYPILALVGTDAKDADTGPVAHPFTLKAPADRAQVVSPLTTLVQTYLESTGGTSADAASAIEQQLGLNTSAFANFTQDSSNDGKLAGTLARLIVVATQAQRANIEGATDQDGKALTTAQIDAAISTRLISILQQVALNVLDDPTLRDPSISIRDKQDQMEAAARLVASSAGLSRDNIAAVVAAQAPAAGPADERGVETVSLRWLTYADPLNYMYRVFHATAAQNTPDANGKLHFTEARERAVNGAVTEWGSPDWIRPQVYWTGSSWFNCPTDFVHETTPPNAAGESDALYCNAIKSRIKRSNRDISGQKIIDVVRSIRAYPSFDSGGGSFANWGPNPDLPATQSMLGTAVFPAGSVLSLRTVTDLAGTEYYDRTRRARIPSADQPNNPDNATWRDATLAQFVQWNAGNLIDSPADVHGNNTYVLLNRDYRKLGGEAAYKRYMVAFKASSDSAGQARFYECEGDMATRQLTPPRNSTLFVNGKSTCATLLNSTYTIAPQGDGKVLRFAAEPTQLSDANSQNYRLFIERNGIAFVGFKDKQAVSHQQRLNGPAGEALGEHLGIH